MEFVKGADLSSLLEVERCGGVFRDGDTPEELFSLLRRFGVNGIRLRLWNDPYDADGADYGGGVCDLPAVLTLARRAKNASCLFSLIAATPCPHPRAACQKRGNGLDAGPALLDLFGNHWRTV